MSWLKKHLYDEKTLIPRGMADSGRFISIAATALAVIIAN